ncbi:MAG: N-formylglutamate deformylase, partial [Rhodoferax sp.]
ITRNYGQPSNGIHAIQLEMCWHLYMQEKAPYTYDPEVAARIQPVLKKMVASSLAACMGCYEK